METLTGNLPPGLRPVARRLVTEGDLNQQTRRIVIPRAERPVLQPEPEIPLARLTSVEEAAPAVPVKTGFYLYPCEDQTLLGLFPRGIHITTEWLYVGRNPYNEIEAFLALVLNRDEVSMVHAALMEFEGKAYVVDLGSSNGTRITRDQTSFEVANEPMELISGDFLEIGPVLFRIINQ